MWRCFGLCSSSRDDIVHVSHQVHAVHMVVEGMRAELRRTGRRVERMQWSLQRMRRALRELRRSTGERVRRATQVARRRTQNRVAPAPYEEPAVPLWVLLDGGA